MPDEPQPRDTGETLKLVGIVALLIVLAVFVIANTRSVRVEFVVKDFKVPLIFVLIITALLGALVDRLFVRRREHRVNARFRAPDETADLERKRLQYLATLFDEKTMSRLRRLEVRPGWRCLDIGAGSGSVARALAALVAPDGEVLATDVDERFLGGDDVHLEFRIHDVTRDELPIESFDLAHARNVLHSVGDRAHALDAMVAATRPGGLVVVEDPDWSVFDDQPLPPEFAKLHRASQDAYGATGSYDKNMGGRLPRLLADGGLVEIEAEGTVFMMHGGTPSMEWYVLGLERSMQAILDAGLVDAATAAAALAEVRDRDCHLLSPLRVTAWGRKPRRATT